MSLTRTLKQKLPFLRYSFLRAVFGGLNVMRTGQMGDGREEATAEHVVATAPAGDIDAAIEAIDNFAYDQSILMNVGDERASCSMPPSNAPTPRSPWSWAPIAATAAYGSRGRPRAPNSSPSRNQAPTPPWHAESGHTPV